MPSSIIRANDGVSSQSQSIGNVVGKTATVGGQQYKLSSGRVPSGLVKMAQSEVEWGGKGYDPASANTKNFNAYTALLKQDGMKQRVIQAPSSEADAAHSRSKRGTKGAGGGRHVHVKQIDSRQVHYADYGDVGGDGDALHVSPEQFDLARTRGLYNRLQRCGPTSPRNGECSEFEQHIAANTFSGRVTSVEELSRRSLERALDCNLRPATFECTSLEDAAASQLAAREIAKTLCRKDREHCDPRTIQDLRFDNRKIKNQLRFG